MQVIKNTKKFTANCYDTLDAFAAEYGHPNPIEPTSPEARRELEVQALLEHYELRYPQAMRPLLQAFAKGFVGAPFSVNFNIPKEDFPYKGFDEFVGACASAYIKGKESKERADAPIVKRFIGEPPKLELILR